MLFSNQFLIQNLLYFENCFQNKYFKNLQTKEARRQYLINFFCFMILHKNESSRVVLQVVRYELGVSIYFLIF